MDTNQRHRDVAVRHAEKIRYFPHKALSVVQYEVLTLFEIVAINLVSASSALMRKYCEVMGQVFVLSPNGNIKQ